jgi:glutathione S-transferase
MEAKLYVILGSHACRTGMLLLDHKGIEYETVELTSGLHPFSLRLRGLAGDQAVHRTAGGQRGPMLATADKMGTVPTLVLDGQTVRSSKEIARVLDERQPDPPLFPSDPDRRRAVEEAEDWGDEVLQMAARRVLLAAASHGPDALVNRGDDGRLGPLLFRQALVRLVGTRIFSQMVFSAGAGTEQRLLEQIPGLLDHVDELIADGVLNGDQLNAADYMIAPSLALLTYRPELRDQIEQRPALGLIDRVLPDPVAAAA